MKIRKRKFGASSAGIPGEKFIVFNQNYDQIGNREKGERLSLLVSFEQLKLASALMFLSPYIPMLFMGEEYGEDNPFYFFVRHSEEDLVKRVKEGRKKEFESFNWEAEPPDPQEVSTFNDSRPDLAKRKSGKYNILFEWNRKLIFPRRSDQALRNTNKNDLRIYLIQDQGFLLHRKSENEGRHLLCFFNLSESPMTAQVPSYFKTWKKILDSKEKIWMDPDVVTGDYSSPGEVKALEKLIINNHSAVVYCNE